jgi:TetR/AcrR family transcriptional regulator
LKNKTEQSEQQKTEQRILEAAKKVFILRGLDGTRMQEIADEAGINKALLHYYFRSKDKLFETVFDAFAVKLVPDLTAILEKEITTIEKIELIISRYIEFLTENPQVPLFIITEINRDQERIKTLLSHTRHFSKMQEFGFQLYMEMQMGKIKNFNPFHLMLNIISLCVFPFIAKPMVQNIMQVSDADYAIVLQQRKEEVIKFVRAAVLIESDK